LYVALITNGTTTRIADARIPARARDEIGRVRGERRILVEEVLDAAADREVLVPRVADHQVVEMYDSM
jgi:hypothetical protein